MKQYLLCVYQPDGGLPPPEVLEAVMREVDAVNREMKAAGAWVFAGGLHPQNTAKVARPRDGHVAVTDGPFAESKEFLGGLCIIAAPDSAVALEWAEKLARATTLPIELREFQSRPGS